MIVLVIVQSIAIALLAVIVFGLLRTHAEILRALDRAGVPLDDGAEPARVGPVPVAAPTTRGDAVDIVGTVPGGGPVKVALGGDHHTLLAFLSSGCRTCQAFWTEFASPMVDLPGHDTRLVIVAQDPAHDSESRLAELAPTGVRTVCSSDAWTAYGVPGSPYFALVDGTSGRVVGSGTATAWEQVRGLLSQALGDEALGTTVDDALAASGIGPGHPSLYPDTAGPDVPQVGA
ncbi:MAG: hypothetical protein R2707_20575 [Acidimicrobiales bacterium]